MTTSIADTLKDAEAVEERIAAVFDAESTRDRAQAVRSLFTERLDFDTEWGTVSLAGARGNVELPADAHRVASLEGVEILYVDLGEADIDTNRIRKAEADAAAKRIEAELGDDLLLVFTNREASQLHLIRPSFDGARVTLRRMAVERDLPRRTPCQQIAEIYRQWREPGKTLSRALDDAFNVEAVTDRFFKEYDRFFKEAEGKIDGFGEGKEGEDAKRVFTLTLFNRLMFVYFLSRKGWVMFRGDADYLNALWEDYRERNDEKNFYNERLAPLFERLHNEHLMDLEQKNPVLFEKIGNPPFLNGGLFAKQKPQGVTVPDEAVRPVIRELFARFNFTVMESTPYDVEVAVDPEMLGKVFEELVNERNKSGAYYTPRPVVSYMCREALKGYVAAECPALPEEVVAAFVDAHDTARLPVAEAASIALALERAAVVDPACGSGAYLLGMMQEIVDLHLALYRAGVDAKSLYDLKLHIIERNLYGVDMDDFAVNIAMLRLWLSLAIDYEGEVPPPLPNLEYKIVLGDSLLGPDPDPQNYGSLFRNAVREQADALARAKARYFAASGGEKANFQHAIHDAENALKQALADDAPAPDGAVDWRVAFADVFHRRGGFDVAIANPPYVQLQKDGGRLGRLYESTGFATFVRSGDLYQLFYERGCQLLRKRGLLAYITSNSWLRAEYGKPLRRYFAEKHTPLRYLDLGKDVFASAIVDSGVLLLRTGAGAGAFPAVDMDRLPNGTFPPPDDLWKEAQPDGEAPWSILSRDEYSVMEKMQAEGTPLKNWDVRINYGIKTGLNEAFIIDNATREALIAEDSNSAEIIKPVLRGRDIRRYQAQWAGKWLLFIPWHFPLHVDPSIKGISIQAESLFQEQYPAVYRYLLKHKPALTSRNRAETGIRYEWYALQRCAADYHAEFTKEKIIWMDMGARGTFAYESTETYINNAAYLITGNSLKYICGVLNSSLSSWYMRNTARTTGMGLTIWHKAYVERIPIPSVPEPGQHPIVELVDKILREKSADPNADTRELEEEIDWLVYDLYGLTNEETAVVADSLWNGPLSEEEEDAALVRVIEESLRDRDESRT